MALQTPQSDIDLINVVSVMRRPITRQERKMSQRMTEKTEDPESDPNIFAELGLPDADTHFLKAQIVAELYRLAQDRRLTQAKAGALMGISHPRSRGCSRAISGNTPWSA